MAMIMITTLTLTAIDYDWFSFWVKKAQGRRDSLQDKGLVEPTIEFNGKIDLNEVALFTSVAG